MMYTFKPVAVALVLTFGAYTPISHAEESYLSRVGDKFLGGVANMFTGLAEVPKNLIDVTNKTNPVVGATGGLINGTLQTVGRTASGVFDIITSPIPTESMVEPKYVWTEFDRPTSYGGTFK